MNRLRERHGLILGIIPAVALTLALSLALVAYLNGYKFEQALLGLVQSRGGFVLRTLERTVESHLRLGLPLASLDPVRPTLRREAAADGKLLSISVYDSDGRAVVSSNPDREGRRAPARWRGALPGTQDRVWRRRAPQALVLGVPLEDALGETVGGIVLRYDRARVNAIAGEANRTLLLAAMVLAVVFTVPVVLAAALLLRPVSRGVNAMADDLETTAEASDPGTVPPQPVPGDAPLGDTHAAFRRTITTALTARGNGPA